MVPQARVTVVALAALLTSLAAPAFATTATPRSAEGAVVVVATTASERGIGAGTIVAASGDRVRILTAKHVAVFGALSVRFGDADQAAPARILATIPGHDIAVIEATVDPAVAASLRVAHVGAVREREAVHVRGSGLDGPDFEPAAVTQTRGDLPDGPAAGRYALACALCHRGDSGAGVFDAAGDLVGVYVGYWTYENGARVSIAEIPSAATDVALSTPFAAVTVASSGDGPGLAANIARSNTSIAPATDDAARVEFRAPISARNVASTSARSAMASGSGRTTAIVPAAESEDR